MVTQRLGAPVGVIALGGLGVTGPSFWPEAVKELRH